MEMTPQQALALYRATGSAVLVRDWPDLTQRQLAILLDVYLSAPPHTVRGLAEKLGISKPAVSRALDRLGQLEFAKRKIDETDKRSILVQRTVKGSVFLREFGDLVSAVARDL
ncbi:MarR family transcriptional regulator [Algihabitans albus]|uniref:MarR family transcriptional regulator n=1 Tax=Algihabitans albus TaxID=2164067 RepID=UPI000E5D8A19|nr:MarR family transcriptional regulator [Algihabitans albus]